MYIKVHISELQNGEVNMPDVRCGGLSRAPITNVLRSADSDVFSGRMSVRSVNGMRFQKRPDSKEGCRP